MLPRPHPHSDETLAMANLALKCFRTQRAKKHPTASSGLLDFIPRVSPRFQPPIHLAPLVRLFERAARGEQVRALVHVPPRHGKTETLLHGAAWTLAEVDPRAVIGYVTYEATLARSKSRNARDYARAAGVSIRDDADALGEWRTKLGGGMLATGIGGPLTGHGVQILIVDDPFKNAEEAESQLIRDKHYEWFQSTGTTRVEPSGSIIVSHTRWHNDDLIGRLEKQSRLFEQTNGAEGERWEKVDLPAIDDRDEALWPARWPLDALLNRQRTVGPYVWTALYQGKPQPRGGKLFKEPARYQNLDITGRRILIAVDVAGTKSTRADRTVAVVGSVWKNESGDPVVDVIEVMSIQEEIPEVCRRLEELQKRWGSMLIIEGDGIGKAVPQTLLDINPKLRLRVIYSSGHGDKFTRAQPVAAAWNDGRIRVPLNATWLDDYLFVMDKFTGVNDARDDEVDATSHLFNNIEQTAGMDVGRTLGQREMGGQERAVVRQIGGMRRAGGSGF
jgi:predicted phage terminase large subunit-like protein